ncbi:hypothetical protein D8674_034757 [Pyrus ussuriensis x Pyrus communis]|uniref:Uncharacterized protein n=1 Tax=Pyrus ussuriensis x Pyrus communis TaxID=2448454 RepID=A0A5N5GF77_9ROSA|nr:hypothetical protein D8674_034757 [Pyrus ussuriensis x Pyrus communis]
MCLMGSGESFIHGIDGEATAQGCDGDQADQEEVKGSDVGVQEEGTTWVVEWEEEGDNGIFGMGEGRCGLGWDRGAMGREVVAGDGGWGKGWVGTDGDSGEDEGDLVFYFLFIFL